MTQLEAQNFPIGLYRLWWTRGGCSLAAVGRLRDGTRWYFCCEATGLEVARRPRTGWHDVERIELIEACVENV